MSAAEVGALQLALLDAAEPESAAWRVRSSRRARRLTVKVFPGGRVEIIVPEGTRPGLIAQFVARHREWIDRKVAEFGPLDPGCADRLPEEVHFEASGERWPLLLQPGTGAPRLRLEAGQLRLCGDPGRKALLRHALQRWLLRRAHLMLEPWLQQLSAETGLAYARMQVRRQRTRWGSCSRRGTISLNACLAFQSPAVVRYLLVHELAHTRHMNHSPRFWSLVGIHEPAWRELDAELAGGWRKVPAWAIA